MSKLGNTIVSVFKSLILIKYTKSSNKPDNHKNPFTNEHKQAIHRKSTKTR